MVAGRGLSWKLGVAFEEILWVELPGAAGLAQTSDLHLGRGLSALEKRRNLSLIQYQTANLRRLQPAVPEQRCRSPHLILTQRQTVTSPVRRSAQNQRYLSPLPRSEGSAQPRAQTDPPTLPSHQSRRRRRSARPTVRRPLLRRGRARKGRSRSSRQKHQMHLLLTVGGFRVLGAVEVPLWLAPWAPLWLWVSRLVPAVIARALVPAAPHALRVCAALRKSRFLQLTGQQRAQKRQTQKLPARPAAVHRRCRCPHRSQPQNVARLSCDGIGEGRRCRHGSQRRQ